MITIAEAKKAVKELEQPILKYQILNILEALEKSVRELPELTSTVWEVPQGYVNKRAVLGEG